MANDDRQSDHFIREVDEEMRRAQLKSIWDRFAPLIIGVCVLVVLLTAGYRGWLWYQERQAAQSGDRFLAAIEALQGGNRAEGEAALAEIAAEGGPGYPVLARLRLAGEKAAAGQKAEALAAYDEVAADTGVSDSFRRLATIRAALLALDTGDLAGATQRATPLNEAGNAWRHSAREILGAAAYQGGRIEEAREFFTRIQEDPQTPPDLWVRSGMMVALIDGQTPAPGGPPPAGAAPAAGPAAPEQAAPAVTDIAPTTESPAGNFGEMEPPPVAGDLAPAGDPTAPAPVVPAAAPPGPAETVLPTPPSAPPSPQQAAPRPGQSPDQAPPAATPQAAAPPPAAPRRGQPGARRLRCSAGRAHLAAASATAADRRRAAGSSDSSGASCSASNTTAGNAATNSAAIERQFGHDDDTKTPRSPHCGSPGVFRHRVQRHRRNEPIQQEGKDPAGRADGRPAATRRGCGCRRRHASHRRRFRPIRLEPAWRQRRQCAGQRQPCGGIRDAGLAGAGDRRRGKAQRTAVHAAAGSWRTHLCL
jgi:hypothetical protein